MPLDETRPEAAAGVIDLAGDVDVSDPAAALAALDLTGRSARRHGSGGEVEARRRLDHFVDAVLDADARNEPSAARHPSSAPIFTSAISRRSTWYWPHVTPTQARQTTAGSFIEELVVRRELSMNRRVRAISTPTSPPDWARKTLEQHAGDEREYVYSAEELEACNTHDAHWNDAMRKWCIPGSCITTCVCTGRKFRVVGHAETGIRNHSGAEQ